MATLDEAITDVLGLSAFHVLHVFYDYGSEAWQSQMDTDAWHPLAAGNKGDALAEGLDWAQGLGYKAVAVWTGTDDEAGYKRIVV